MRNSFHIVTAGLFLSILPACLVTAADLQEVAASVAEFESVLADQSADVVEVQAEAAELRGEIEAKAEEVVDRARDLGLSIEEGLAGGSVMSLLTAVGLNMYRNAQRRRREELASALAGKDDGSMDPVL